MGRQGEEMKIRLIAAVSRNGIIGKQGRLPWSIPEALLSISVCRSACSFVVALYRKDFSYFLDAVRGDVCITGRKSYDEFGSAIPGAGAVQMCIQP